MAKRNGDGRVADMSVRILQRIQQDLSAVRRQTESIPQIGRDISELAAHFGRFATRLDEHELRLKRVERKLGLP